MGTAIKHVVPDRVKPSFVIFDIRALRAVHQSARMSKISNVGLTGSGTGCFCCTLMATVGVKGLSQLVSISELRYMARRRLYISVTRYEVFA